MEPKPTLGEYRVALVTCRDCIWWVMQPRHENEVGPRLGRCRRHAPTLAGWPATSDAEWCGDHKIDEAKL